MIFLPSLILIYEKINIMKIPRLSILDYYDDIEYEKLFSEESALSTEEKISIASTTVCREIIKICEKFTGYQNTSGETGRFTYHWIKDKLYGSGLEKLIELSKKVSMNPLTIWFYKIDDNELNFSKIIKRKETYTQFMKQIKIKIANKYNITTWKFSDDEYKTIFKYIALILSGEIEPELYQTSPWWGDSVKLIKTESINYKPTMFSTRLSKKDILKKLTIGLININEDEENKVLLRVLNEGKFD